VIDLHHPGLKQIGVLMLPAVFGAAIYQINVFVGTILASLLPKGSVSYLYYADRIVELPLGVFAIALGTAVLPSLSAQVVRSELADLKRTISFSLSLISFVTLPAMILLIYLRVPILSVLFQRGAYTVNDTLLTAQALLYYSLGLWAFSSVRIVVSAFYAFQDTRRPMEGAIIAFIVNVFFSIILMGPMKHGGLALATSLGSAVNVIYLSVVLWRRIGSFLERPFFLSLGKVTIATILMIVAMALVDFIMPWSITASFPSRCLYLTVALTVGVVTFFAATWLQKSQELVLLARAVKRKLGK